MSAYSNISIQRWTNLSIGVAIIVGLALALLLAGPAFMPDTMLDKLTVLFVYVLLAAMWNALAGYGGMISAGQLQQSPTYRWQTRRREAAAQSRRWAGPRAPPAARQR